MNVPKLRFPGFQGEWKENLLGEVTTSFSGGTPKSSDKSYYSGTIPFIRSGEINSSKTELFINEAGLNSSSAKMVNKGDILYALYGATSGEVGISQLEGAINQAILCIRPLDNLNRNFIKYFLESYKTKIISTYLQGGQGNLSGNIIKNLVIHFSNLDEQEKIAIFLSTLEKKINLQQEKIDLLREQKKGFMQKIFNNELRFANFNEQWSINKISDVATLINGRAYKKEELLSGGKYRVLRVGNFFTNDSWYYSDLELETNKYAEKEDLLYAWSASFGPKIWREEKVIYHYHIWKVIPNTKIICRDFLYHWFIFDKTRIISDKNGSTLVHITKGGLEETTIEVPCLEEQEIIVKFLNKLDDKINLNEEILTTLKNQKQTFMQQMFI